jgi:hypothetical protein
VFGGDVDARSAIAATAAGLTCSPVRSSETQDQASRVADELAVASEEGISQAA